MARSRAKQGNRRPFRRVTVDKRRVAVPALPINQCFSSPRSLAKAKAYDEHVATILAHQAKKREAMEAWRARA